MFDILGKKKGMTIKPCQLMEYQIKNISIEKSCRKCAAKASPRPLYNFGSCCMQEIILKVRYFETGLSKSLKKGNLIFSFESNPFQ